MDSIALDQTVFDSAVARIEKATGVPADHILIHATHMLYGTKGTIIFDNSSPTISLFKEQFTDDPALAGKSQQTLEIKIPVPVNNHNVQGEVEDFCRAIHEGTPVPTTGEEGASTVSVCLAIVESFKTGNKVKVDYNF